MHAGNPEAAVPKSRVSLHVRPGEGTGNVIKRQKLIPPKENNGNLPRNYFQVPRIY